MIDYNKLFDDLYPINRSILGEGYRKSLIILSKFIKFKVYKVKSGEMAFDWTVPKEWKINSAYLEDESGKKIIEFKNNNLSVVNYSSPVNKFINLNKLQENLFSIPKQPNHIPYITSYYKKNWGFCIKEKERKKLKPGKYHAVINSSFVDGHLEFGVKKIPGKTNKDFLISSYLCHPSMANNELSGPLVMVGLYNNIVKYKKRKFNYIFLINPETIGSICFLKKFGKKLKKNLVGGLVLTCLGGPKNKLSYKKSRSGNSSLDKLFLHLSKKNKCYVREFDPTEGSDERQFCSSGFNLPVGQAARTIYGQYKEYHTSGDDKKFMNINKISASVEFLTKVILLNEKCSPLIRKEPYCELQLGKRGLYPNMNTPKSIKDRYVHMKENNKKQLSQKIMMYILSYADGNHDIIDVANMLNLDIEDVAKIYDSLISRNILI
tara:strand:+ start:2559 stop:3863 length:1305 start_codon:yes stop_codon:yes gene_type:complete